MAVVASEAIEAEFLILPVFSTAIDFKFLEVIWLGRFSSGDSIYTLKAGIEAFIGLLWSRLPL